MAENFLSTGLAERFVAAVNKMGLTEPTAVQKRLIPEILTGKDVVGQSPTGTGKTLAYLLPLLQRIDPSADKIQGLVLAPTYELAMQIFRQSQAVLEGTDGNAVRAVSLIGGANVSRQIDKLKSKPHVAVGSAGRMMELSRKGKLDLRAVKMVVLDEADRMLDDQNLALVRQVVKCLPEDVQFIFTTATVSRKTLSKAEMFAKKPAWISVEESLKLPSEIEHSCFFADFRDKIETLRKVNRILEIKRGLVFVNKTHDIIKTVEKLKYHGLCVAALTGDAGKLARKQAMDDFARGKVNLLIASDLAARGLDIPDIDYVIQFDIADDERIYLHRAGRTGRAGKSGACITLASPKEAAKVAEIAKRLQIEIKTKQLSGGRVAEPERRKQAARPRRREKE